MKIVLFKGKGLMSRMIRWQTRSEYSHAAILDDGVLVESREWFGVRAMPNWIRSADAEVFDVDGLRADGIACARDFLCEQIGKKYDWLMVLRFVSRFKEDRRTSGKWFCSELVFAAIQKAGVNLLRDTEPWEVSPGLLARSPLLRK